MRPLKSPLNLRLDYAKQRHHIGLEILPVLPAEASQAFAPLVRKRYPGRNDTK